MLSSDKREALLSYASLQAELNATNIDTLIAKYDQPDDILNLVRDALVFSEHILREDKSQLPYQLCGRLWSYRHHPEIARLCDEAMRDTPLAWADTMPYPPLEQSNGALKRIIPHPEGAMDMAWSPDSSKFATAGGEDHVARLWDAHTGIVIWTVEFRIYISAIDWSPDGQFIATGSDNIVTILNAQTGAIVSQLQGHTKSITSIAWSPDGSKLATGSYDTTARVWDVHTGTELFQITQHTETVECVAWSPDGSKLATGGNDNTARVWDIETQTEHLNIRVHDSRVYTEVSDIAWSPDGRWLATGSEDNIVHIWDAQTGAEVKRLVADSFYMDSKSVAWSPDGEWLAIGSNEGELRIWHIETDAMRYLMMKNGLGITAVVWSPDGKILASLSDETLHLWDITRESNHHSLKQRIGSITCIAWSPDSTHLAVGSLFDRGISLWDIQTSGEIFFNIYDSAQSISWSLDGTKIAMGSYKGKIFDAKTGAEIYQFSDYTGVYALAWSPDGSILASSASDNNIAIWDTHTWAKLRLMSSTEENRIGRTIVWSPDSHFIAAESSYGITSVWDVHTGKKLFQMMQHEYSIRSIAWSHDGTRIVTTSFHTMCIYDAKTGTELLNIPDQNYVVRDITWSPDSQWLAIGCHDNAIRLYNAKTGICHALVQMDAIINTIAWSPDGQWLGYGCHDGHLGWMKWRGIVSEDKS